MLLRLRIVVGVILCVLLFSSTVPILMGVRSTPERVFGGEDIAVLVQTNKNTRIGTTLADVLREQEFAEIVSPEIYAFCVFLSPKGEVEPVFVRGIDPEPFFELEGLDMPAGILDSPEFLLVGKRIADRYGLKEGGRVTITGSTSPAFTEMTIFGIVPGDSSLADEMLVPLEIAKILVGFSGESVQAIRVKTSDEEALIDFLQENRYEVMVSKIGGGFTPVNENRTAEQEALERLIIRYSDTSSFTAANESYISAFLRTGAQSVGMVVLGFIALSAGLMSIGIIAIFARAVLDRRRDIGVLAAIGAGRGRIYRFLLRDIVMLSMISAGIGVLLGAAVVYLVGELEIMVAFGITIIPELDPFLFVLTFLISIGISCCSGLVVSAFLLRESPERLMRGTDEDRPPEGIVGLSDLLGGR